MATLGFPNGPVRFPRPVVAEGIARGEVLVAEVDGVIVGTYALQWSDAMFWGDQPPDAGYVHRLAVHGERAGRGLGVALLAHAAQLVRAQGRTRLRLDAPAGNVALASYYERLGFTYCGDTEGDHVEPDGSVRHWVTRRYERVEEEEPRR